jgi:hypothetical protein
MRPRIIGRIDVVKRVAGLAEYVAGDGDVPRAVWHQEEIWMIEDVQRLRAELPVLFAGERADNFYLLLSGSWR